MTTTVPTTAIRQVPTDALRPRALLAGGLYLITFVASIPPVRELSLGIWPVVKGFTPSPIRAGVDSAEGRSDGDAAVASAAVSR